MKALAGLAVVLGISMFINAITATWPLNERDHDQVYRLLDVLLGLGFWALAWVLFSLYRSRQIAKLAHGAPRSDVDVDVL
jgi:hypothetical protein